MNGGRMDKQITEYVRPITQDIGYEIAELEYRIKNRNINSWNRNDFELARAAALALYKHTTFVLDAIDIVGDLKQGVLDAKDREGGTPR